ncbi:MAG: DUF4160 domain-containing protein [Candidatus Latescibacteria bacterium]|nr:DUF4160 domain-containing protein [Candidatus Latescibacterota bacterium]
MPEISRFYGIIISMYYDDHNPPHFHARYGGSRAAIEIPTLRVLDGKLPPRVLGLVVEWASQHQPELMNNWEAIRNDRPPQRIQPLL